MSEHHLPLSGADLERWRIGNRLTKMEAADAFGLQKNKWDELTSQERSADPIEDPVVAMLLQLYVTTPGSAPIRKIPDLQEFYEFLGLQDDPRDRDQFALLIGRSSPSVYRLLLHNGKPGRPVVRWIEAIQRLDLKAKATMKLMTQIATTVGERQNIDQVLVNSWTKQRSE